MVFFEQGAASHTILPLAEFELLRYACMVLQAAPKNKPLTKKQRDPHALDLTSCRLAGSARWWRWIRLTSSATANSSASAGMLASAEVNLDSRTVMKYLLSPGQKVAYEAGRER